MQLLAHQPDELRRLAELYGWGMDPDDAPAREARVLLRTMDIGVWEDLLLLERATFRHVNGVNIRIAGDKVSQIGIQYGKIQDVASAVPSMGSARSSPRSRLTPSGSATSPRSDGRLSPRPTDETG